VYLQSLCYPTLKFGTRLNGLDARPTVNAPDDDPFLWLEHIEEARSIEWVIKQNAATLVCVGDSSYGADRDVLAAILDHPDNIPFVSRRGSLVFNLWKDKTNPRGLWRSTTLDRFRANTPAWENILDLDKLADLENEDWIWHGVATLPPDHELGILSLSQGGSDSVVFREFNLKTKEFVAGGFVLPGAKGEAVWLDKNTLLLASAFGEGMMTSSGYPRTTRIWSRGSDVADAQIVCEANYRSMGLWPYLDRTQNTETIHFNERLNFYETVLRIGDRTGPKFKLKLPLDIEYGIHRDWLAVKCRSAWTTGGRSYPQDTLLGTNLSAFVQGKPNWQVLFSPSDHRALRSFRWVGGKLLLSILDELVPTFKLTDPSHEWASRELLKLSNISVGNIWPLDVEQNESNGDLVADVEGPTTPPSFLLWENAKNWQVLRRGPEVFFTDGLAVSRHEAISADGEHVPYVQIGPHEQGGEAPVHLSGYGGFGAPELPHYRAELGKLWLERGGTCIVANIRGGGEFGTRWHDAGRRDRKHVSHDDFAAVASDLVARGITSSKRIAASGHSNGGLLIANMMVRYPDRFGALFCTTPLTDMRRYAKLLAGASWIAEFGDPNDSDDWTFLQTYSAYHLAKPGQFYPPILFATNRKDDRVHPSHARKMAAKLQAMGYEAYLYEVATGGHGVGKDHKEHAEFMALGLAFLRTKIGWEEAGAAPVVSSRQRHCSITRIICTLLRR
jgi:prolyl oligopeptidase